MEGQTNETWSVSRCEIMEDRSDPKSRCPRCAIWEVWLFDDIDDVFSVRSWTGMEDRGEDYRVCDWHLKRLLERRLTHVIYAVNHADMAELLNAECEEAGQWPDWDEPMRRLEELMASRKEEDSPPARRHSKKKR